MSLFNSSDQLRLTPVICDLGDCMYYQNNGEQAASTHEKKAKPVSMQNSQDDKQPSETAMEAEPIMNTSKIKAD